MILWVAFVVFFGTVQPTKAEPKSHTVFLVHEIEEMLRIRFAHASSMSSLETIMKKISTNYPTIQVAEKEIEVVRKQRSNALWSQFAISGGLSQDRYQANPSQGGRSEGLNRSPGLSISMSIGVSTWFHLKGLELTSQLKKAQKKALQLQLAFDAAKLFTEYSNASSQIFILERIKESLKQVEVRFHRASESLSEKPENPPENLTEKNTQLLKDRFLAIDNSIQDAKDRLEIAAVDLRRFLGENPPDFVNLWSQDLVGEPSNTNSALDLNKIDSRYPVPKTPEMALSVASQSPALMVPSINSKLQEVSWYMALYSGGPSLVFSANKNWSSSEFNGVGSTNDSQSINLGIGFRIGGSLLEQLSSLKILEEVARLNVRAVRLQLLSEIEKSYLAMAKSRRILLLQEQNFLKASQNLIRDVRPIKNENFETVIQNFIRFEEASLAFMNQVGNYSLSRITIMANIGQLLDKKVSRNIR